MLSSFRTKLKSDNQQAQSCKGRKAATEKAQTEKRMLAENEYALFKNLLFMISKCWYHSWSRRSAGIRVALDEMIGPLDYDS